MAIYVKSIISIKAGYIMELSLCKLKLGSYIGSKQGHQAFSEFTDQVNAAKKYQPILRFSAAIA